MGGICLLLLLSIKSKSSKEENINTVVHNYSLKYMRTPLEEPIVSHCPVLCCVLNNLYLLSFLSSACETVQAFL